MFPTHHKSRTIFLHFLYNPLNPPFISETFDTRSPFHMNDVSIAPCIFNATLIIHQVQDFSCL